MLPYFARHINNWFKKDTLEYHYQKHLILLFAIHCMRMFCRHDDGFAFVEFVFYAVDGDFTGSVEAGDEGVAAGLVGADSEGAAEYAADIRGNTRRSPCSVRQRGMHG